MKFDELTRLIEMAKKHGVSSDDIVNIKAIKTIEADESVELDTAFEIFYQTDDPSRMLTIYANPDKEL